MNEPSPSFLSSPDAGSRGAGEVLRRARESQGITLEALASMIKVTPAKLEALEQGRHDLLPDPNFTRALAMTVCRALKIDPGEVLAALPAAKPTPLAEGKPPLNQPFKEAKGGTPLFDRHTMNWSALLTPKYLAPAVLLVGAVLIYALPDSILTPPWESTSPTAEQAAPAAPSSVTQTVPVQPSVASAALPEAPQGASTAAPLSLETPANTASGAGAAPAQGAGASLGAPGSAAPAAPVAPAALATPEPRLQPSAAVAPALPATAAPAAPSGAGNLSIALAGTSWIEVRDAQGRKVFSGLARAGDNLSLDGPAPLQVRIGNVSGVQMRYKGQPVDLSAFTRNNVARIELK